MNDKVKVLFLAANPRDSVVRLRIDEEIREIGQKLRMGTFRDRLELVSEWAVRVSDLQEALLRHQPDIVHFSGYGSPTNEIILENEAGMSKAVNKKALAGLFRILKDNIRVVVLNACYARDQAQALTKTIDFTIGMKAAIKDRTAIVFAAYFYQSLAFGRSVKEAFDLAVNEFGLEGIDGAQMPELLVRKGADASKFRIVRPVESKSESAVFGDQNFTVSGNIAGATVIVGNHPEIKIGGDLIGKPAERGRKEKPRPVTLLSWLFAAITIILATDVLRRFLGGDGGWSDITGTIVQSVLIVLATIAVALKGISLVRRTDPLVKKAARLGILNRPHKARRAAILTGVVMVIAFGLWLSLPAFAHYYNERGFGFQYNEEPDLSHAFESYQRAVRLKPSYAQAHYNLASIYEDLQPEKAIEEYLLAIKYDSLIYPAYNNLARLYLRRGKDNDFESALNILNQARDLSPQDKDVQYSLNKNLGWANYAMRRYRLAEEYLQRAILLRGEQDGAAAHCLLAYVLKEEGKDGMADECSDCVRFAPGEKDLEAKWVSDAQECLIKGDSK